MPAAVLAMVVGCGGGPDGATRSGEPLIYRITDGACGDVVFVESLGPDSAAAQAEVAARKAEFHGDGAVRLEAYRLEVVDQDGETPEPRFYALRVLDAETGHLVHSVSEVITTSGDLFGLRWCPD